LRVKFLHDPPGIAAGIGRIIPRTVAHHAPSHELGPRIVRVAIAIEKICNREAACIDRIAVHRPLAGELVIVALLAILRRTQKSCCT